MYYCEGIDTDKSRLKSFSLLISLIRFTQAITQFKRIFQHTKIGQLIKV